MATIKVGDKVRLLDNSYYSKDNDDDLRPGVEGIVAYSDYISTLTLTDILPVCKMTPGLSMKTNWNLHDSH